jgi:DNA-binding MarR family transcriptional regulator
MPLNRIGMKRIDKNILEKRIDRVSRPEPTISIFSGKQFFTSGEGEQGSVSKVFIQLSVDFRKKQLYQLRGPILGVFLCIALHINEEGLAWPSIAMIASETGYNKDTVLKCLRSLERMGFISAVQGKDDKTGKFRSNTYQLFPKNRIHKAGK